MEGETVEAASFLRAVEQEICRIPEVSVVRIVPDDSGRPAEVHVLATATKLASNIVRDIQSVAMASFGLDLETGTISVVQLDSPSDGGPAGYPNPTATPDGAGRVIVDGVTALRNGTHCSAQVCLRQDDDQAVGVAEGLMASGSELRLVATATLTALRELEPAAARADVEAATVVQLGDRMVALASIVFVVPPYEEVVAGAAIVRTSGAHDAIVRAVLNATNRRLHQLGSR